MKNRFLTLALALFSIAVHAQINTADSTAQVITYWEKGEKQNYSVTVEKLKVKGTDTTSREMTAYDVEVTVLNATDKSYTVEWQYKKLTSSEQNPALNKLMNLTNEMKVVFKTDHLGSFIEVQNWKEIKDYIQKACESLRNEYKDVPELDKLVKQMQATFSTKEAIESASIKDIQQFHFFHGAKYKLGEVMEGQLKVPNLFGKDPFDADVKVVLDELNIEDNNYIVRASQEVNKEQLIQATYDYLTVLAKNMNINPPKKEELGDLGNEMLTASRIHGSGWVVYSVQTTTVTTDTTTNIEERIIELK